MEQEKRKAYKTSKQQLEANKRYLENNPEARVKKQYSSERSTAKRFIAKSTSEDLEMLKTLIDERLKEI